MRRAGDVCFSQVFRDRGGELIKLCSPFSFHSHQLGPWNFPFVYFYHVEVVCLLILIVFITIFL